MINHGDRTGLYTFTVSIHSCETASQPTCGRGVCAQDEASSTLEQACIAKLCGGDE